MRPLTEDEVRTVFEKLHKFIGKSIKALVAEDAAEPMCFRLQRNRVFYVREDVMRRATNVSSARQERGGGAVAARRRRAGGRGARLVLLPRAQPSPHPPPPTTRWRATTS